MFRIIDMLLRSNRVPLDTVRKISLFRVKLYLASIGGAYNARFRHSLRSGVLSNLTEPRGNTDVRHEYSIDCVHRPGSRRYFQVPFDELNTAHCTFTSLNPTSCTIHPSSSRVRSSSVRENCRWTLASRWRNILIPRTALVLSQYLRFTSEQATQKPFYSSRDELPVRGTSDDRTTGESTKRRIGGGTTSTFGTCRYVASTRRMHRRADDEKKRDRGRERERGRSVSERAKARHASSPADWSTVRLSVDPAPETRLVFVERVRRLRRLSLGDRGWLGDAEGGTRQVRRACARWIRPDATVVFVALGIGTCHSVLSRSMVHTRSATRTKGLISRRHR